MRFGGSNGLVCIALVGDGRAMYETTVSAKRRRSVAVTGKELHLAAPEQWLWDAALFAKEIKTRTPLE